MTNNLLKKRKESQKWPRNCREFNFYVFSNISTTGFRIFICFL